MLYRKGRALKGRLLVSLVAAQWLCQVHAVAVKASDDGSSGVWTVTLPRGSQPEGIAAGEDGDMFVACLSGSIIHVDLRSNTSSVIHKEHGVHLSGVKFDKKRKALFVAGTLSGKGYVFHLRKQAAPSALPYKVVRKEVLDFGPPGTTYINDVALSSERAYFTNSLKPLLYYVPREHQATAAGGASPSGKLAPRPIGKVHTGKAFEVGVGQFHANGITVFASKPRKDVLLVANTHKGSIFKVVVPKPGPGAAITTTAAAAGVGVAGAAAAPAVAPRADAAGSLTTFARASQGVVSRLVPHARKNGSGSAATAARPAKATAAVAVSMKAHLAAITAAASVGKSAARQAGAAADAPQAAARRGQAKQLGQAGKAAGAAALQQQGGGAGLPRTGLVRKAQASVGRLMSFAARVNGTSPAAGVPARALLSMQAAVAAQGDASSSSSGPLTWSTSLAASIAKRLGLGGKAGQPNKEVAAEVVELALPHIAGLYTKHMLVDGLWVRRNSMLYVADNYNGRVFGVDIKNGLDHAAVSCVWQGPWVHVPTTLAWQAGRLWWVDAHLDTCFPFLPCPGHKFELRGVTPSSCQAWA